MAVEMKRKPHYTTRELAAILKIGPTKVAKLVDSGDLKGWQGPDSRRYVPHAALVAWLRGRPGYESTLKWLEAA